MVCDWSRLIYPVWSAVFALFVSIQVPHSGFNAWSIGYSSRTLFHFVYQKINGASFRSSTVVIYRRAKGTDRHYSFDINYIDSPTCHLHKNPLVFHCVLAALHDRKRFLFQIELRDQLLQMFIYEVNSGSRKSVGETRDMKSGLLTLEAIIFLIDF